MLDNVENMIFNGINLANTFTNHENGTYFIVNSVSGRGIKAVENTLAHVAGMDGSYPSSSRLPSRQLTIDITMKGTSFKDLRKRIERLNEILFTRNVDVPIVFSDEPDRVYYGRIDEVTDTIETSHIYQAQITIICSDPFKYGQEKKLTLPSDAVMFTNQGTAEADPIFEMEVLKPATFAMVSNEERYQLIGKPADVEQVVVDTKRLVVEELGNTLDQWNTAPVTVDSFAEVSGTMGGDGSGTIALSYGTGSKFHGPALIRDLGADLKDFEISANIDTRTERYADTYRIEIYLFDNALNMLGKMGVVDSSSNAHRRSGLGRVGTYAGYGVRYPIYGGNYRYENFGRSALMHVRVRRIGNVYEFYIAHIVNGIHRETLVGSYTDVNNEYSGSLRYVQMYISKHGDSQNPYLARINNLRVFELLTLEEDQTPYIVWPGDTIIFDHKEETLLINGEDHTDLKDFGGSFFKLKKGDNTIVVLPEETFKTTIRWRERYQ